MFSCVVSGFSWICHERTVVFFCSLKVVVFWIILIKQGCYFESVILYSDVISSCTTRTIIQRWWITLKEAASSLILHAGSSLTADVSLMSPSKSQTMSLYLVTQIRGTEEQKKNTTRKLERPSFTQTAQIQAPVTAKSLLECPWAGH